MYTLAGVCGYSRPCEKLAVVASAKVLALLCGKGDEVVSTDPCKQSS